MSSIDTPGSKFRLIFLVLASAIIVGFAAILSITKNSYEYLGVGILCLPVILLWVKKPAIALYTFIFICFIPQGLIPNGIYDYLYRILALVVLFLWLFYAVAMRYRFVISSTTLMLFGFLMWSSLTLIWTTNVSIGISFLQIYFVRFVIFLVVVPNLIRSLKTIDGLMKTLAICAWVIVLATLLTVLGSGYSPGMRLKVFGENENSLGIHILLMMIGVIWMATRQPNQKYPLMKWLAFAYLLAAIGVVAASGSRGSAISLAVALLAFWLWKPTRIFGKVSLVYLIIIGISAPLLFQTVIERFTMIDQANTLLGGREALWSAAWAAIKKDPWLGVGLGNSNYVLLSYLQEYRSIMGLDYASVHNPILTIWMETGMPGLFLYLASLASAIVTFIKQFIKDKSVFGSKLTPYYGIVASVFFGYMLSWIKGGGIESDVTYFLMLAALILPATIKAHPPVTGVE